MLRYALVLVVLGLTCAAGSYVRQQRSSLPGTVANVAAATGVGLDPDVEDLYRRRYAFAAFMAKTQAELEQRVLRLEQAASRIFYYCLQNYPEHLNHLSGCSWYNCRDVRTRIARNLILCVRSKIEQGDGDPYLSAFVLALEEEWPTLPFERLAAQQGG